MNLAHRIPYTDYDIKIKNYITYATYSNSEKKQDRDDLFNNLITPDTVRSAMQT